MVAWIDGWYAGLGPGLRAVLTASWQASVLVVLVLAVQAALGRWLSPRWRYALWSVVVLRLMLPVTPGSAVSVFNLFRGNPEVVVDAVLPTVSVAAPMDAIDFSGFDTVAYAAGVPEEYEPVSTWSTADVALTAWLAGAALVLGVLLLVNIILALRLRRGVVLNDPRLLELLETCKREMGVKRAVRLIMLPGAGVSSPALAGVFRPTLLVPPGLLDDLPREELRFILLHELAHVKKHDIAMNWLLIVLSALHWFNPLLWFAFSRLRADRELARDAMVLLAAGADASQAYGQTIIRILERLTRPRLNNPALAGIGDGMGQLKRRLRMIALSPKRRPSLTVVGVVLLAILAAVGLTDAAERGTGSKPGEPTESVQATTTKEAVESEVAAADQPVPTEPTYETRVYDIHDLLVPDLHPDDVPREERPTRAEMSEQLHSAITETVGHFSEWSINGGDKSSIVDFGDKLIIRTSTENHAQIEALLTMLRAGDPGRAGDGWRARFDAVYRLDEGEVVKRIAPPFIPERMEYYRHETDPAQVAAIPEGPDVMHFKWNNGLEQRGSIGGADMTIERLLNHVLDLYTYEYVGDRGLLDLEIPGDWIYDFDAEGGAKREALVRVIEGATGRRLRIESKPMERDVIVAEGNWRFTPFDAAADDRLLHVYAGDDFDPADRRWTIHGDLNEFFRRTGWELGVRIEDRVTERPEGWSLKGWWYPSSRLHEQDMADEERSARLRSLLDNLSEQTGLTFTVQKRVEDVWVVSE